MTIFIENTYLIEINESTTSRQIRETHFLLSK